MGQDFLPHHVLVAGDGAPSRWMLVLHGILGSGGNFRTFARRLAAARPGWGFVLVDLRMHGQSQDAPPPHTITAAADDLVRLEHALALPVAGVLGHSFGGKVALAYVEQRRAPLEQAWILDASPGARREATPHETTTEVLGFLRRLPDPLPSRERFLELAEEASLSRPIADWLAMNVRRAGDGFRFRLDLDAIEALLLDYFATDLWRVLDPRCALGPSADGAPLGWAQVTHVVLSGRSPSVGANDRARLRELAAQSGAPEPAGASRDVRVHVLEGAGHWVHVDAPDALFALVSAGLAG